MQLPQTQRSAAGLSLWEMSSGEVDRLQGARIGQLLQANAGIGVAFPSPFSSQTVQAAGGGIGDVPPHLAAPLPLHFGHTDIGAPPPHPPPPPHLTHPIPMLLTSDPDLY